MGAIRPGGGGGGGGPVTIADISDAGAAGADVLAAATEADARTALGAAAAAGAVSLGTAYDAGLSTSAYLDVAGTPSAAPEWGPGQSLVMLLLPVATPSGVEILAMHSDTATTAGRGWHLRCGDNAGARGEFSVYLRGLAGNAVTQLPGADFGGALNVPHVFACAITAGGVVRYSWDGGTVRVIAALGGTYNPPISGDPLRLGVSTAASPTYPSPSVQPVALRAYSTVLSDADLVAVAATRTAYRLAAPSAGTLVADVSAAQWWGMSSPASTVIDAADTARRWRMVGALSLQGQS